LERSLYARRDQIYGRLRAEPQPREFIERQSRIPSAVFEKALEKLWTHSGVVIDADDNLGRGSDGWRDSYLAQGDQKRSQIEAMLRYAQSSQCRMSSLVRHFGDTADSRKPCGICDFCAPERSVAQRFRDATAQERTVARDVMHALRMNRKSVGKLHTELCGKNGIDRDGFEELIGAMARSGLVTLEDAVFEKDGKQIPFRYASITGDPKPIELSIRETAALSGKPTGNRSGKKEPASAAAKQFQGVMPYAAATASRSNPGSPRECCPRVPMVAIRPAIVAADAVVDSAFLQTTGGANKRISDSGTHQLF
jgi:hypothetical protein